MAFILLRRTCTPVGGSSFQIVEDRWDTDLKQVNSQGLFGETCTAFEMIPGQTVEQFCVGSTNRIITYNGTGGTNTIDQANSALCCSISAIGTVEDGTNANTKKLVISITGTNQPFEIETSTGGGFNPISDITNDRHIIDNIGSGTFTFNWTVRDASSCTFSGTSVVNNQVVTCDVSVNATGVNASNGGNDGQILVVGNGGATPYQFSLDGGAFTTVVPFTGVSPGSHTVTIRDANNCEEQTTVQVGEDAGTPPSSFPVDLTISRIIPYRFKNLNASGFVYDNELFNDETLYGTNKACFEQLLGNTDTISIQIIYLETTYNTIPKLVIRDAFTDVDITEINFTSLSDGFYQIEATVPALIQNRTVYFVVVSTDGSSNLQDVARSEFIKAQDRTDSLVLEYSNDSDYDDVKYSGNAYTNRLRIPIINFFESPLQTESEVIQLSDRDLKLFQDTKKIRKLRINFAPDYIHDKIVLALSHDNVIIDNVRYVQEAEYEYLEYKVARRLRRATVDLKDQNFIKNNVIT